MRKIDANAYNKKIHGKLLELNDLVKRISPENIKFFNADLVTSAESYVKVLKECSWDSDSNFNGIEMHKVKDLIDDLKAKNKTRFHVVREITHIEVPINGTPESRGYYTFSVTLPLPELFDGRNSVVFPAIFLENTVPAGVDNYEPRLWRERICLAHAGGGSPAHLKVFKRASAIDVQMQIAIPVEYRLSTDVIAILWR